MAAVGGRGLRLAFPLLGPARPADPPQTVPRIDESRDRDVTLRAAGRHSDGAVAAGD